MATKAVTARCPICGSEKVTKNGHHSTGKQVYRCNNSAHHWRSFVEEYTQKVCEPEVRRQVQASGRLYRNTGNQSYTGYIKGFCDSHLKKTADWICQVNSDYIQEHEVNEVDIVSAEQVDVEEAEMDGMWSFVHDRSQQYWLWWTIDQQTSIPLVCCFGTRGHRNLDELRTLPALFHTMRTVITLIRAAEQKALFHREEEYVAYWAQTSFPTHLVQQTDKEKFTLFQAPSDARYRCWPRH